MPTITPNQEKLDEFKDYLLNKGRSPQTAKAYLTVLNQFFSLYTTKQWTEINNKDIDKYITWLKEREMKRHEQRRTGYGEGRLATKTGQLMPSTINWYLTPLKKFFRFCGMIELADGIELAKKSKWTPQLIDLEIIGELFQKKDMENLKKLVGDTIKKKQSEGKEKEIDAFYIERNAMLFYCLFNLGIRIGEAANLKKESFNFNLSKPIVMVTGKTGQRTILISDEMVKNIKNYTQTHNIRDYLFCSKSGGALSVNTLKTYIWEIFHLGLGHKYHAHTLRHAYATFCLDAGRSIKEVSDNLGHASINTTARYLDVIQGKNVEAFNPADESGKQ